MSEDKKNSALSGFLKYFYGNFVVLLLGFISLPLITRVMSREEYGRTGMFTSAVTVIYIFAILGMDQTYIRYYYKEGMDRKRLMKQCLFPALFLVTILCMVYIIFSGYANDFLFGRQGWQITALVVAYTVISVFERFLFLDIRMSQNGKLYSNLNILSKVLYIALVIIFAIRLGDDFRVVLLAMTISLGLVTGGIGIRFLLRNRASGAGNQASGAGNQASGDSNQAAGDGNQAAGNIDQAVGDGDHKGAIEAVAETANDKTGAQAEKKAIAQAGERAGAQAGERAIAQAAQVSQGELMKYGIPFILVLLMEWLLSSCDKYALRLWSGYSELGIYNSAMNIMSILLTFKATFVAFWSPVAMERYEGQSREECLPFFRNAFNITRFLCVLAGLCLILFKDLIVFILGSDYRDAARVIPFLSLMPIFSILFEITNQGIKFVKKNRYLNYASAVAILCNIIGNALLVPILGGAGAALATGLTYMAYFAIGSYFAERCYPVGYGGKKTLVYAILLMAYGAIATFGSSLPLQTLAGILGIAILCLMERDVIKTCVIKAKEFLGLEK